MIEDYLNLIQNLYYFLYNVSMYPYPILVPYPRIQKLNFRRIKHLNTYPYMDTRTQVHVTIDYNTNDSRQGANYNTSTVT